MNRTEAEAAGYTVDSYCYPWVAYKGDRFNPTEIIRIETDKEAEHAERLAAVVAMICCGPENVVAHSVDVRAALLRLDDLTKPGGIVETLIEALRPFAAIMPPLAGAMMAGMALRGIRDSGDKESRDDYYAIKRIADAFPVAREAIAKAEAE